MDYFLVAFVAFVASGLTLFSGFGLGTILLPAMILLFPPQLAVAATAVVHLANNVLKLVFFGRYCNKDVFIKFGFIAIVAAFAGANLLVKLSEQPPLVSYSLVDYQLVILPVNIIVSVLIFLFALLDLFPQKKNLQFGPKFLPLGGLVSGLFGGLSGHQGAMRSAFLANSGLSKEAFIGTGVTIACLVDITRISVYGLNLSSISRENMALMGAACSAAFLGVFIGQKVLNKVTMDQIRKIVGIGLILISVALGGGII